MYHSRAILPILIFNFLLLIQLVYSNCPCGQYLDTDQLCVNCDPGTYKSSTGSQSCSSCPAGSYCPNSGMCTPIPCAPNQKSAAGRTSCSCCYGSIPNAGQSGCDACPDGYVSDCASNCQVCSTGSYADAQKRYCNTCERGYYCSSGIRYPCPSPMTSNAGATNVNECFCCGVGRERDSSGYCVDCSAGRIAAIDCTTCTVCPATKYADPSRTACWDCQSGHYCVNGIQRLCEAGFYCDGGVRYECPAHMYSAAGATACSCCGAGQNANAQRTACVACATGTTAPSACAVCTVCSGGYYAENNQCKLCESGFWCANGIRTACQVYEYSPAGASSADQCQCCSAGNEVKTASKDGCQQCQQGWAAATCTFCELCEEGEVERNRQSCDLCLPGFWCSGGREYPCDSGESSPPGSKIEADCYCCNPGSFEENGVCLTCTPGSISTIPCSTSCSSCGPGKKVNSAGDACEICPAGSYCPDGVEILCPVGHYSPPGSDSLDDCICCGDGNGVTSPVKDACQQCQHGFYSRGCGDCLPCQESGAWSPVAAVECFVCEEGYFVALGRDKCIKCPPSYWSPAASDDYSDCVNCGCSLHGDCFKAPVIGTPACQCWLGYSTSNCGDYGCFGFAFDDIEACNRRGICIGHNDCLCFENYVGDECEGWLCYDIHFENKSVCSGRDADSCICKRKWSGHDCSKYEKLSKLNLALLIVLPISLSVLLCVYIIFGCIALLSWLLCKRQKRELQKYENIDGLELLLEENEVEMKEIESDMLKLNIREDMFVIKFEEIEVSERIASGGGGTVFKALWKNNLVCFKLFHIRTLLDEQSIKEFEQEVALLSSLKHDHIVEVPRIVMRFAENGNLENFLIEFQKTTRKEYPLEERIRFLKEISIGMEFIHENDIIHRDLKTQNVIVDKSCKSMIMDFGFARFVKGSSGDGNDKSMTMHLGTSSFMAPELTLNQSGFTYSNKVDVWMLMTYDFKPYGDRSFGVENIVAQRNLRPEIEKIPKNVPDWIKEMIVNSWDADPNLRLPFKRIIQMFEENSGGKSFQVPPPPSIPSKKPQFVKDGKALLEEEPLEEIPVSEIQQQRKAAPPPPPPIPSKKPQFVRENELLEEEPLEEIPVKLEIRNLNANGGAKKRPPPIPSLKPQFVREDEDLEEEPLEEIPVVVMRKNNKKKAIPKKPIGIRAKRPPPRSLVVRGKYGVRIRRVGMKSAPAPPKKFAPPIPKSMKRKYRE